MRQDNIQQLLPDEYVPVGHLKLNNFKTNIII